MIGREQHGRELRFVADFRNENAQEDREELLVHAGKAITPGASIIETQEELHETLSQLRKFK